MGRVTCALLTILAGCALGCVLLSRPALAAPPEPLAVGAQMQDFGLRSIDVDTGKLSTMHWLSDYVGDKATHPTRALVLSFYANWCKPCLTEMPQLQHLQDVYGPRGLQVLGVHVRSEREDVDQALALSRDLLQKQGVRYPVLFDRFTRRNQQLYLGDEAVLPCSVVIDKKGKIVARFQGGQSSQLAALEAAIQTQLADQHATPPSMNKTPSQAENSP